MTGKNIHMEKPEQIRSFDARRNEIHRIFETTLLAVLRVYLIIRQ